MVSVHSVIFYSRTEMSQQFRGDIPVTEYYAKWKQAGWIEKENNNTCFHSYKEPNSKILCMLTYMCECVGHKSRKSAMRRENKRL